MEIKIVLLISYCLFGCREQNNSQNNKQIEAKVDTLTTDTFYNFEFIDSEKYIIEWGTKSFKNVSKDTFDVLGNGSLELIESNDKYLVLNQPCGSGCALYVLLPLIPKNKEFIFWNVVYNDLKNEFIIATMDPGLGKFGIFKYLTGLHQEIILTELCPAADKAMCIDTIFFNNNEIIFQYQGSKWQNDKPDYKVKSIRLE